MFFENIKNELEANQFEIISIDHSRRWGVFFVIAEQLTQNFANTYFEGLNILSLKISGKPSSKILIVAPSKRLSLQHTNANSTSDEDEILMVQIHFGR